MARALAGLLGVDFHISVLVGPVTEMSPALASALAKMRAARGTPAEWIERESLLLRFIAAIERPTRVFCRGEVHLDKGHFPAVLTHNPIYKQTLAWAPSGRKNAMESHHDTFFHGAGYLVGIAREVLAGPETAASGIETRSAIDAERRGPEGESPARKGTPK